MKVIEALACGTPVIGTHLSFEGIAEEYSEFMLQAETPNDFLFRMEKTNMSLDKRVSFKNNFLLTYSSKSIKHYIYM